MPEIGSSELSLSLPCWQTSQREEVVFPSSEVAGQEEVEAGFFEHSPELEHKAHLVRIEVIPKLRQRGIEIISRHGAKLQIGHCLLGQSPQDIDSDAILLKL